MMKISSMGWWWSQSLSSSSGLLALALALCLSGGLAGDVRAADSKEATKADKKDDKKEPRDESSVTSHSVTIEGVKIGYTATAGTLVLKEEDGKPQASFFYVAYTRTNAGDVSTRPITFSFNGGPGSASVWLHLGTLGPRRVVLNEDGTLPPPPFRVTENEHSILDDTDLVFIDPVSTGFSRPVPGEDAKKYHGVDEDIRSVGEFIRLYITRAQRWASPKFLIGESYGTTRASALSGHLESRYGIYLNGVMLVSVVLDFQTISYAVGNELPFPLFLPTLTATAWYHKKLPSELQADLAAALKQSESFALGEYATALLKGNRLTPEERRQTAQRLAQLTGLSVDFVERSHLRVNVFQFFKELLRSEGKTIGRFDSRMTGVDRDGVGDSPDYDPSYTGVLGPFTGALNDYLRRDLKFESDLPYEILTGKVQPWNYGDYRNRYLNVAETLRQAMAHNPYLKVFVANGVYDLATPYFATRYTFDHFSFDPKLQQNITMVDYEGGHMMYTVKPALVALKKDLSKFIRNSVPAASVGK
ncbi:MAG: peptidase S10 [Verrucomicrobiales bacterium]|nr:peptidase S10 [Verrucomicrobiales bacterium]